MIAGKIEDIKVLIEYYGEEATVADVLKHSEECNFSIFEAQDSSWDSDLF